MLRTERVTESFLQRREQPLTEKGFTVHRQVNKRRVPSHADPRTEGRWEKPPRTCHGAGVSSELPSLQRPPPGPDTGLSGRGGSEGKVRSGQVCTPVHYLPARRGAPSVNFLSRKLIFSSCEKQKEEKHVNAEKSGSWGRKLLPQLKEVAAVSSEQASPVGTSPGHPSAVPRTRAWQRRAAFPAKHRHTIALAMRKPCSCHSPPHPKYFFFAEMFSEARRRAQARESTTRGWQRQRAERPNAALHSEVSPLITLGVGPLAPGNPSESPRSCKRSPGLRMRWEAVQGHLSQRVFHQSNLRASNTLQQFLYPRGVRIHTHLP